jgi:hypothetical protein
MAVSKGRVMMKRSLVCASFQYFCKEIGGGFCASLNSCFAR